MFGFIGLGLLAAIASACVASVNIRGWYGALQPPPFVPGDLTSARLWALLAFCYGGIGLAAWLVWRRPLAVSRQRVAMNFWGWQLALGAAWPAVFFGLHLLLPALAVAAGLVACAASTLWRFAGLDRTAALLSIPYFTLALFALYLASGFWWLNH